MKKEKTVTESLSELFVVAEEFVKIMEVNKISSHFQISGQQENHPVQSEMQIKFYQPQEDKTYCLKSQYTHIEIGNITLGKYGRVNYKFSLTSSDIDEITKEAKKVLSLFRVFAFGSIYEKRILEIKNNIRMYNRKLRESRKEMSETVKKLENLSHEIN